MAFSEDLTPFFDLGDFAETGAFYHGATLIREARVIFTEGSQAVEIYSTSVEEPAPTVQVQTAELAGVKRGHTLTLGTKSFRIERIEHDGTGVSTVHLAKL